jgi:hypothetical protein
VPSWLRIWSAWILRYLIVVVMVVALVVPENQEQAIHHETGLRMLLACLVLAIFARDLERVK